jgi:hypothetical protein
MQDDPVKTNLPDVLLLLLKASVLATGKRTLRLTKGDIMRAEGFDMKMERSRLDGGDMILTLIDGQAVLDSKIIVGDGNPLGIVT